MYFFETQARVRYGETDQMGYLYYGNYAQYFEVGRVETIRSLGLTYKDMEEKDGIWLPVVSMQIRFVRPAYYDELLTIRSEIRKMPNTHITFHSELFNEKNKLVCAGSVRLCFFHGKNKRVIPAPDYLLDRLKPHFITNLERINPEN